MSFIDIYLILFLVGAVIALVFTLVFLMSRNRYRRELIDTGGAETTLGKMGRAFLEGEAIGQGLIAISIGIAGGLLGGGGEALLFLTMGFNGAGIGLIVLVIICLILIVIAASGPGIRARSIANRILRSYWSHHNEEILRLELRELKRGGETQLRAFDLILKRGCKASLVAKDIRNESTVSE
jgi:hypothetical protein